MSHIINYNSSTHDLYIYNSGPTIDPTDYRNNVQVYGVSYNNNLYIKNATFNGFTFFVDFSGMDVRPRGAPSYGFDQFLGQTGFTYSGIKRVNNITYWPNIIGQFNGNFPNGQGSPSSRLDCYYPGCPADDFTVASNYNFWNNGAWTKILISPKHFIACGHYVGYAFGTRQTAFFLGKDNVTYAKAATKKFHFASIIPNGGNAPTYPTGYGFTGAKDWVLFELDEALTAEEQNQIKIYKFVDIPTIPFDVPRFYVNPQSVVTVRKNVNLGTYADIKPYYSTGNTSVPFYGLIQYGIPEIADFLWVGDSGTPWFVYVPNINETCFGGLWAGGDGIGNTADRTNFYALQSWVQDQIGYTIGLVTYGTGSTGSPDTINIDGLTYTLGATVGPIGNNDGITQVAIDGLCNGYRYSFVVVAYNENGYSGYAKIDNVITKTPNVDYPPLYYPPPPDL